MMRCESFDEIVADMDRSRVLDDVVRDEALAHAGQCPRCSRSLARARALDADLQTLAAHTRVAHAPASVEDALREAFRQSLPTDRRATSLWRIAAAAAAVVVLGLFVAGYALRGVEESPTARVAAVESGFIPLGYDEPLAEMNSVMIVRVQLTREGLAGLGWPVDAGAGSVPIQADVILGEDGVARAIRFVE